MKSIRFFCQEIWYQIHATQRMKPWLFLVTMLNKNDYFVKYFQWLVWVACIIFGWKTYLEVNFAPSFYSHFSRIICYFHRLQQGIAAKWNLRSHLAHLTLYFCTQFSILLKQLALLLLLLLLFLLLLLLLWPRTETDVFSSAPAGQNV